MLTAAEILALEQVGERHFRSLRNQGNRVGAIFGGQPLAQALRAAQATAPDWPVHNLSGMFLRGGDCDKPVDYRVEPLRDGRRYASRRVIALQDGRAIFDCLCSFHEREEGLAHQTNALGDVPPPEALMSMVDYVREQGQHLSSLMKRSFAAPFPVEIRMTHPEGADPRRPDCRDLWLRVASAADLSSAADHSSMLAFASDYWLAGAVTIAHAEAGRDMLITSVNHSMWFHAPVRADEWLLYRTSSPWSGQGRGLTQGQIFDRGGTLIATVAQEVSIRKKPIIAAP